MSAPTYMTTIQVDVFDYWDKATGPSTSGTDHLKVYYDLVELTPDQINAIVKMTSILTRWIYDSHLPKPLDDQVTGELNINCPE